MSRIRALYSVIQYLPDAGRAEAANAGVVLYVPSTRAILIQLVGDDEAELSKHSGIPGFPRTVAEAFGRLEAARQVWKPGVILVPETNRKLRVPFAYSNGRVNFILPQSLAPGEPSARAHTQTRVRRAC